ncbi:MAG: VanW family protein [Actinomycetota bacterium]|nr:VanW family protein [Actinomycetota bacterium]
MTPQQNLALHRAIWLGVAAGVVLALGAYLVAALQSGSTAASGTTVAGVDIGGLTREEAQQAVEQAVGPTAGKRLRVVALDQTFIVRPALAGLTLDAAASVAPAFGHTWNPIGLVGRLFGGDAHPAVAAVDDDALAVQTSLIADALAVPPVEPTLEIIDGEPVLTAGKAGRSLDQEATAQALIDAVLVKRAPVQATVVKVEPSVTPEAQEEAMTLARAAVGAPVAVRAESVTANISGKAIGRALSFTVVDGTFMPSLDGAALHNAIRKELSPIEEDGRDATFRIRKGTPRVVKSKVGRGVSDEALAVAVGQVLAEPRGQRTVTVPVGVRQPSLTTEQAEALGITERLSTFTQSFPYAAYRVQNIGQAAERINGTLLLPGETFSLNDTILERTEKNGYTEGFVVGEGGVFAEALGGGVSTSATAAWTAAFYAGMERVQTVAHSIYISRYKPGLEATVAWGLFDLKFRNDMPTAVFITSSITNGSITVSFWGTKEFDKIEAEYGNRTNIRKFDTIYDKSKECLGQGGVDGFTITVDRVFYKDGKEVRREPITTTYKPAPEVICGKKPEKPDKPDKPVDPSPSPSASPSPSDPPVDEGVPASPSPSPTKPNRIR